VLSEISLKIRVRNSANISGSRDVFYKGNPAVNTKISGSGIVIRID
jgi:hypothetical protein